MTGQGLPLRAIGRYQVSEELGRGAMAVVYKGFDPVIGRTVALKTLAFDTNSDDVFDLKQRLYREACAAGTLNHPNIVTIYDVIQEDTTLAVALEFIDGQTLEDLIPQRAPLTIEAAMQIFEQIAAALDYAGARGIVHRDIKPANIMVTSEGRVKVADFGIARLPVSDSTQSMVVGRVVGSPSYMSPEQVRGEPLDARSDLFSASIVLYELLTKKRPFTGDDLATTMYRIVHEPMDRPHQFNPAIGPAVTAFFDKALAKKPDDRYQTGADICIGLREAAAVVGESAANKTLVPIADSFEHVAPVATGDTKQRPVGVMVAAAAVVVVALSGFFVFGARRADPTTASPSSPVQAKAADLSASVAPKAELPAAKSEVPASAPATVAAAPDVPAPAAKATIGVKYEGEPFPFTLYAGSKAVRQVSSDGASVSVDAGSTDLRAVNKEFFLDQRLGSFSLKPAERRSVSVPNLVSVFVGVKDELYQGLQILLDGRALPEPYPAQLAKVAPGNHKVVFRWTEGGLEGKQLAKAIDLRDGRHFVVRADTQTDEVAVQKLR